MEFVGQVTAAKGDSGKSFSVGLRILPPHFVNLG
jgi:hypothetical protein